MALYGYQYRPYVTRQQTTRPPTFRFPAMRTGLSPNLSIDTTVPETGSPPPPGGVPPFNPQAPAPVYTPPARNQGTQNTPTTDWLLDPAYLAQKSAYERNRKANAGNYLAQVEAALLGFGSQTLAKQVLGGLAPSLSPLIGPGLPLVPDSFYSQISDNPDTSFSTLGQLNRRNRQATIDTRENVNNAHLFYGGHGAAAVANTDYQNKLGIAQATQAIQNALSGYGQTYLNAQNSEESNLINAENEAYQRAVDLAVNQGIYPPNTPTGPTTLKPPKTGPQTRAAPAARKPLPRGISGQYGTGPGKPRTPAKKPKTRPLGGPMAGRY